LPRYLIVIVPMSSSPNLPRAARLPRLVTKYDLITYFGVSYKVLWSRILTDDLLEGWGFPYSGLKRSRSLPPGLTTRIYRHFNITDLDADNLLPKEETTGGHRAPEDI
jgi:hypothetical protein